MMPSIALNIDK